MEHNNSENENLSPKNEVNSTFLANRDLPYMKKHELDEFIQSSDFHLTREEIEYLYLTRRRKSIDMFHQDELNNSVFAQKNPLLEQFNCVNLFPYKVMVLGDEGTSGHLDLLQLFTLTELMQSRPDLAESKDFPPFDIQTKILEVSEDSIRKDNFALQLWLPICSEDNAPTRSLYYRATDAFVVIFSINSIESFEAVERVYLPEILQFIEQDPAYKNIPIILVGNKAETRVEQSAENVVSSDEAVRLSQEHGVAKYIEIYSDNTFHIHEVFQQVVIAISQQHSQSNIALRDRQIISAREEEFFRSMMTVSVPDGSFDQIDRTFELNMEPDVDYYYTLDGSDPSKLSPKYTSLIHLKKPFAEEIKIIGFARGRFSSEIASFSVPEISAKPDGYFDVHTKAFHIAEKPDCRYFLTFDESSPNRKSYIYENGGIYFDSTIPNSAFVNVPKIPNVINVIAVEKNRFRSTVSSFKPFDFISAPLVFCTDGTLKIDTLPGLIYKYTLDGSLPTYDSATYTSPILLPNDGTVTSVKVAAFPKLMFPSKVVEVGVQFKSDSKSSSNTASSQSAGKNKLVVKMTKTAIARQTPPSPQTQVERTLSPRTNGSPKSMNQASIPVRPQKAIPYGITYKEQEVAIRRKLMNRRSGNSPPKLRVQEFKVAASGDEKARSECQVSCKAEGTNVDFEFEKNVTINSIMVKTPGKKSGPAGYELFSVNEEDATVSFVGKGSLLDVEGEQKLEIASDYKSSQFKKLTCHFLMALGQTSFKILDMKVDCKIAK